jgi:hypothetical protein
MLNKFATMALRNRHDISRFMVHMTRDNRFDFGDKGKSARASFISIWNDLKIRARRAHCLHREKLKKQPIEFRRKFSTACFTETPLTEIRNLLGIPYRQTKLEPYGFVFTKECLIRKGAQHVQYVNRYAGDDQTRSFDRVFWTAVESDCNDPSWRLLPFISAMDEGYDFAWEREWRVREAVHFKRRDLVCVILPEGDKLTGTMNRSGVAVISPEWTHEETIEKMARQLRQLKLETEQETACIE